jgi:KDO transferase-3
MFFSFAGISRICEFARELLGQTDIYLVEAVNRHYGRARIPLKKFRQWAAVDDDLVLPEQPQKHDCRIGFSRNLDKGFFSSRTVLYGALQIAYHLGYRRLFILGMDLDYRGLNPRFYEASAQMRPSRIERDLEPHILPAFRLVSELCQRGELEVYNLSPTSRMPESIIPRLTLEEALALVST